MNENISSSENLMQLEVFTNTDIRIERFEKQSNSFAPLYAVESLTFYWSGCWTLVLSVVLMIGDSLESWINTPDTAYRLRVTTDSGETLIIDFGKLAVQSLSGTIAADDICIKYRVILSSNYTTRPYTAPTIEEIYRLLKSRE